MVMKKSTAWLLGIGILAFCVFAQDYQKKNELKSDSGSQFDAQVEPYGQSRRVEFNPTREQKVRALMAKCEIIKRQMEERARQQAQQGAGNQQQNNPAIQGQQQNRLAIQDQQHQNRNQQNG